MFRTRPHYIKEPNQGKTLDRPGLHAALGRIASGEVGTLVVAKLDRISRSVVDFGLLLDWFEHAGADLVALDLGVDTSTPGGQLVANVLASVAQWEAQTIAVRTREGLAAKRARGQSIGRAAVVDNPLLANQIRELRDAGCSLQAIADALNAEAVPTARGGALWRPSSVQTALGYRRPPLRRSGVDLPLPRARRPRLRPA